MTHNRQNISGYHAGDALAIEVVVTTGGGVDPSVLLGNATGIEWFLLDDLEQDTGESILSKDLDDGIDVDENTFTVHVETDETDDLGGQTLEHKAWVLDDSDPPDRSTVFTGSFTVEH